MTVEDHQRTVGTLDHHVFVEMRLLLQRQFPAELKALTAILRDQRTRILTFSLPVAGRKELGPICEHGRSRQQILFVRQLARCGPDRAVVI